jgi:hypothetical protein
MLRHCGVLERPTNHDGVFKFDLAVASRSDVSAREPQWHFASKTMH